MPATNRAVEVVVSILVVALLGAFLVPIPIEHIAAVDTSGWGEAASTMWMLLTTMIVLAVFLLFVQVALRGGES